MPKVDIISGKYGGFCAMVPMMRIMKEAGWDLRIHLCDQHLKAGWGNTWEEAQTLFPEETQLHMNTNNRPINLFNFGAELAHRWMNSPPDAVIVYGDRLDALIGATAAHQLQIPVAHLQAGDISGCIDDETRWAVSCLAKWKFAPDEQSAERLVVRGLYSGVYTVGDHHIDALVPFTKSAEYLGNDYLVVHMHPDTKLSFDENVELAQTVNDMLYRGNLPFVLIQPCNDLHHQAMSLLTKNFLCTAVYSHVPQREYVKLLKQSVGLIGNTSAVCIDAPFLNVFAVNVGNRQYGRVVTDRGDGTAGKKTFEVLGRHLG